MIYISSSSRRMVNLQIAFDVFKSWAHKNDEINKIILSTLSNFAEYNNVKSSFKKHIYFSEIQDNICHKNYKHKIFDMINLGMVEVLKYIFSEKKDKWIRTKELFMYEKNNKINAPILGLYTNKDDFRNINIFKLHIIITKLIHDRYVNTYSWLI